MRKKTYWFIIYIISFLYSQNPFFLEDINPNSESFGETIGPSIFAGNVCVIFFGHES